MEHAQKMKRDLLEELEEVAEELPPNTLDELIDELGGPENVAEVKPCPEPRRRLVSPPSSKRFCSADDRPEGARGQQRRRQHHLRVPLRAGRPGGDPQPHREAEVHGWREGERQTPPGFRSDLTRFYRQNDLFEPVVVVTK